MTSGRGLDGADWLIEGRRGDAYRAVKCWSPEGEFHALGRLFFALAGLLQKSRCIDQHPTGPKHAAAPSDRWRRLAHLTVTKLP
jgi:hypothetical protein